MHVVICAVKSYVFHIVSETNPPFTIELATCLNFFCVSSPNIPEINPSFRLEAYHYRYYYFALVRGGKEGIIM